MAAKRKVEDAEMTDVGDVLSDTGVYGDSDDDGDACDSGVVGVGAGVNCDIRIADDISLMSYRPIPVGIPPPVLSVFDGR